MTRLPQERIRQRISPPVITPEVGEEMGLVYSRTEIVSRGDIVLHRRGFLSEEQIKSLVVDALVDTGAYMLTINDHIREQLDPPVIEEQIPRLADDSGVRVEVAGPVEIRFENRCASADAIVWPGAGEVLLGCI